MLLYKELAPYYYAIEDNHRDIENDIILIRSFLHGIPDPAILDLGCGTGEHLNQLHRYGIQCVGIDSSSEMLDVARQRSSPKINFVQADLTSFDYYNDFNMVISLFGSLDYLINDEDVDKTFWNIWRALRDGGTAILEIWNAAPIRQIGQKNIAHVSSTTVNEQVIDRERGFVLKESPHGKAIVEVNYRYRIHGSTGSELLSDQHVMRAFTLDEIRPFITKNGLAIAKTYSNVLKAPLSDLSNKIILILKKT